MPGICKLSRGCCLVLLVFFLTNALFAESDDDCVNELIDTAISLKLDERVAWRRLIHFNDKNGESDVLSKEFFLSDAGSKDPRAELIETIRGYFKEGLTNGDRSPRCLFPARYYWLSRYLNLPDYSIDDAKCLKFQHWALLSTVNSVSVYLVSGYFGNPASAFGHGMLKLNSDSNNNRDDLFDLAINYGALIPPEENVITYVIKGITGRYQAGFSDRYFYTQDQVYSKTEFRDIWDYQLNLSKEQRELLILHIWEIIGKKTRYLFQKQNCVYRLAELLELILDRELVNRSKPWYIPEELFHTLVSINDELVARGDDCLIHRIREIPSDRRVLSHEFSKLNDFEKEIALSIIQSNSNIEAYELLTQQKIKILNAVLAYHQYRSIAEGDDINLDRLNSHKKILLARLMLPPQEVEEQCIHLPPAPTEGAQPSLLSVGIKSNEEEDYSVLGFSLYSKESVSLNSLDGDEFVLFAPTVGIKQRSVFLDKFDLLRIRNLENDRFSIPDESLSTWHLRIGMDRDLADGLWFQDWNASFGVGKTFDFLQKIKSFGLIDFSIHGAKSFVRLKPIVGFQYVSGCFGLSSFMSVECTSHESRFMYGGRVQYHLNKSNAIRFEFDHRINNQYSLSFVSYW